MKKIIFLLLVSIQSLAQVTALSNTNYSNQTIVWNALGNPITNSTFTNCVFPYSINMIGCSNITFISCTWTDIPSDHYLRIRNKSNNISVINCTFIRTKLTTEQCGIQLKGTATNVTIRGNVFINLNDGIQTTYNPTTHSTDPLGKVDGLLIENNYVITSINYQGFTENGFDFKTGSSNPLFPAIVRNNTIKGLRSTLPGLPYGAGGDAIVVQMYAKNFEVYDNTLIDNVKSLKVEQLSEDGGSTFIDRGVFYNSVLINMAGKNTTTFIP